MVLKNRVNNAKQQAKKVAKTKICALVAVLTMAPAVYAFEIGEIPYKVPGGWSIAELSNHGTNAGKPYKNVHIFRLRNEKTYVQVVDLSDGGHVKLLQYQANDIKSPDGSKTFKGWWRNGLDYWWNEIGTKDSSRVSVINAQFINHKANPTTMTFGVKANGRVVEQGSVVVDGLNELRSVSRGHPLKQMNFYSDSVNVKDLPDGIGGIQHTYAANAIVGKSPWAREKPKEPIGRVYLCAKPYYNQKKQKSHNLLLVYVAESKTQKYAESDLISWDCHDHNTVMLDGSHSRKLLTKGGIRIDTRDKGVFYRDVPQVIGIFN